MAKRIRAMPGPVYNLMLGCKALIKYWRGGEVDDSVLATLLHELDKDVRRLEEAFGHRKER